MNDTENKTLIKQEVHLNHTQFYEIEVSFDRNGFLISNNTRIRLSGELYAKTLSAVTVTNSEAQITGTGDTIILMHSDKLMFA